MSYSVSIKDTIKDVGLWKIIINGYPYKNPQELGCQNKEEAFTATKQAIYCYIHENKPSDYEGIGEAGKRTLNAINKILKDSNDCKESQISNNVTVNKETKQFEVDNIDKNYVSKIYSIKAGTNISKFKVNLSEIDNSNIEEMKITDIQNNLKNEFNQNEKFKILIPIKSMKEEGKFDIKIETKIYNKPILYGKAENTSYQDYALTGVTYEDAFGSISDIYNKNETKIKIIKQDEKTEKRLEGVEFNILDIDKKIIFANLKTNKNGEIEISNMIPGKYYIKETNAKDGYLLDEKLIEFTIELNQKLTININNKYEEKTQINVEEKEITETMIKKLPVTGM